MKGKKLILTADQLAWIRANAATLDYEQMAAHLNCHERTVGKLLKKMNLTGLKMRPWGDEDERILREMAGKFPMSAICRRLRRDWITIVSKAKELGISLDFDHWWPAEKIQRLRDLAAAGRTRRQITIELGERYQNIRSAVKRFGVIVVREYSNQYSVMNAKQERAPKPPRAEKAPRERLGLPVAIRRNIITGAVKYCDRCSAPVVDTPTHWFEHNLRVHVTPIRRIT